MAAFFTLGLQCLMTLETFFYCLYISTILVNYSCLRAVQMCADVVCVVGFKMPIACLDALLALFGKMLAFCKSAYCPLCQHN